MWSEDQEFWRERLKRYPTAMAHSDDLDYLDDAPCMIRVDSRDGAII